MPAAAMSTLSALREKLDAKDIEMKALNDVILKQGRLLQASRAEATDEAAFDARQPHLSCVFWAPLHDSSAPATTI